MLNLTQFFQMRVEPPPVGAGRVHTLSNRSPVRNDQEVKEALKPNSNTESVRRRVAQDRMEVLKAISDGCCTRLDIAAICDISKWTVDERCKELAAGGLIRKSKEGQMHIFRITGDGILELANEAEKGVV